MQQNAEPQLREAERERAIRVLGERERERDAAEVEDAEPGPLRRRSPSRAVGRGRDFDAEDVGALFCARLLNEWGFG
jgi:hypothetical protein